MRRLAARRRKPWRTQGTSAAPQRRQRTGVAPDSTTKVATNVAANVPARALAHA